MHNVIDFDSFYSSTPKEFPIDNGHNSLNHHQRMNILVRHLLRAEYKLLKLATMPRKRSSIQNGAIYARPSTPARVLSPTPSPPLEKFSKRQYSTRVISGTKRNASTQSPGPALKRAASSMVLEAAEDREASPDEGESQNSELDDGDQATQKRLPAVNSDILPLPWKGRLGFAYSSHNLSLTEDV